MSGLEIALLVIGLIIIVASFIFSTKGDNSENIKVNVSELDDRQKDMVRRQILSIVDDQIDDIKEITEAELDKLSNRKMSEMNEYSETILSEINRNHNEVMFLYDMLNEKKKEVNNAVREINNAKKSIASNTVKEEQPDKSQTKKAGTKTEKRNNTTSTEKKKTEMEMEMVRTELEYMKNSVTDDDDFYDVPVKNKNANILNQLDAVVEAVSDDVPADDYVTIKKSRKKTGKSAAKRLKETVLKESTREHREGNANNEKILELSSKGKSNTEIAKELGIGIGEVKLVVDLFKGGR